MSKVRLIMLSMLAVFAASAIASASALAANGCEEVSGEKCLFTLNGSALPAGEIRTLKPIWNGTATLKGKAGGAVVTLTSKLIDVENATILGGIPGTGRGRILFKNVDVVTPKECRVREPVITAPLRIQLVELVKAGTPQKADDVLFEPEVGTVIAELEFEDNGPLHCSDKNIKANVEGKIQAEPSPRKTETKFLTLKAQGAAAWEFRRHGSAVAEKSELKLGGNAATFEGSVDVGLTDSLNWGTD